MYSDPHPAHTDRAVSPVRFFAANILPYDGKIPVPVGFVAGDAPGSQYAEFGPMTCCVDCDHCVPETDPKLSRTTAAGGAATAEPPEMGEATASCTGRFDRPYGSAWKEIVSSDQRA